MHGKSIKKFKGDARSQVPKPKTPPVYEEPKQPEKPVNMKPKMPVSPIAPKVRPTIDPVNKPKLPEEKPDIPDIEYKGSGIDIPKEGVDDISKKPDLTKMPALPTSPLAKVPVNKKNPKAPTIRPEVDPVSKPNLPETKPDVDIPDIEYKGSGILLPSLLMPALPKIGHVKGRKASLPSMWITMARPSNSRKPFCWKRGILLLPTMWRNTGRC